MRVLVVEDFDLLRDSLVKGLSEAGFAVDAAADGEEGLWMAQSNDYDVALAEHTVQLIKCIIAIGQGSLGVANLGELKTVVTMIGAALQSQHTHSEGGG